MVNTIALRDKTAIISGMNEGNYQLSQEWRERHKDADELVASQKTKRIIAAVYFDPVASDEADQNAFWRTLAARIEQAGV